MRRLLFLLVPMAAAVAVLGCPLDIQVRCDDANPCASGQACVAGACVRAQGTRVGEACASDSECGAGLTCGTGFPGGYCLAACGTGGTCPSGSVCVVELGRCLRACGDGCTRAGYGCVPVPTGTSATRACAPVTGGGGTGDGGTPPPDSGTPDSGTPDAGCAGNVPLDGRCAQPCDCATAGAECVGNVCIRPCATDWECSDDRRCDEGSHRCEVGPRIGEACRDSFDCGTYVGCNTERHRCEEHCSSDLGCPQGYRCSPDGLCVEDCTGVPETLGLTCLDSLDCTRCGVCVASGDTGTRVCRQTCQLDRDCDGGASGACEQISTSGAKACRLP